MATLKYASSKVTYLLSLAAVMLYATTAVAQSTSDGCGLTPVIPLTGSEPPAKIVIYPPLAGPLTSRGVVIIQYCTQNLHLVPVFGSAMAILLLGEQPRLFHLIGYVMVLAGVVIASRQSSAAA